MHIGNVHMYVWVSGLYSMFQNLPDFFPFSISIYQRQMLITPHLTLNVNSSAWFCFIWPSKNIVKIVIIDYIWVWGSLIRADLGKYQLKYTVIMEVSVTAVQLHSFK